MTQLPAARPAAFPVPRGPEDAVLYGDILAEETESESVIRRYWRIFYKHRWIVMGIVAACLALALVASMLTQRQYTATARIQVAREAAKVIDMEQGDEEQSGGGTSLEFYQTQYALLKSRSLSESVVRDLVLANNPLFLAEYDRSQADEMAALPIKERMELATTLVNRNTIITPVRGSSIIDVAF